MKLDDIIFFLMRHAETIGNKKKVYRAWSNALEAQLDPAGRKAAENAGKYLQAIGAPIEMIIADSLDRVQETAELVMKSFPDARLEIVRALHPLDMGDFTLKSKDEHPVEPFLKETSKRIPGGETVDEFDKRQNSIFSKIFDIIKNDRLTGGRVLVIGHGSNVAYLNNHVFNRGTTKVGYEGLVNPGGIIAATPNGLIPLTLARKTEQKDKKEPEKLINIGGKEGVAQIPGAFYPLDHKPGEKVPEGGSNCAKCEYLADNKKDCTNNFFIEWQRSQGIEKPEEIPGSITAYCSNWFEEKKQ